MEKVKLMERVISVGGKGAQVTDGDYPEALYRLQAVMVLEKLLGEKIPGNHFEAGRIVCGRKKQKQIEKKIMRIRSWVRFLQISENEAIILTPSLMAADEKIKPLSANELLEACSSLL
ncbi:MAG: hypothetical protein LUG93_13770 [Lachnospiraceae bacterium]|nr:hypothetical protein [Lachnospiraceae bacterium]